MLIIRKEMMDAFKAEAFKRFEREMLDHCKEYFPDYLKIIDEEQLMKVVKFGIKKAKSYKMDTKRNISLYITVMMILGSNFDRDLQYPWAMEKLKKDAPGSPNDRMDFITDEAIIVSDKACGEDYEHFKRAVALMSDESFYFYENKINRFVDQDIFNQMRIFFPEKAAVLGDSILISLIHKGIENAKFYGIEDKDGIKVYIHCMMLMGCDFDTDPLFPWAGEILNRTDDNKVRDLYKITLRYFDRFMGDEKED